MDGAVFVAEKEKLFTKGVGLIDMEWTIANHPDITHPRGTTPKQITTMLIMQLVEQGNKTRGDLAQAIRSIYTSMIVFNRIYKRFTNPLHSFYYKYDV